MSFSQTSEEYSNLPYPIFDSRVDKVATAETKTFPCGYNVIGPVTGRITPLHSGLYFLDFVSADGKRCLIEDKISVWDVNDVNDMNDGPIRILVGTGTSDCTEEFYYVSSAREYQVKYEGKDVQKISFRSSIRINLD
ncbi:hypothetical protein BYT27DRAFT_7196790 [Phlegmacium glaucopus]|nr:hypothetical protein BYT27DRAFT_7196790 [Phlegmacium glaucopus]